MDIIGKSDTWVEDIPETGENNVEVRGYYLVCMRVFESLLWWQCEDWIIGAGVGVEKVRLKPPPPNKEVG